jgi:hypothetical protein
VIHQDGGGLGSLGSLDRLTHAPDALMLVQPASRPCRMLLRRFVPITLARPALNLALKTVEAVKRRQNTLQ